jgi:opacity protein-like surface antigen
MNKNCLVLSPVAIAVYFLMAVPAHANIKDIEQNSASEALVPETLIISQNTDVEEKEISSPTTLTDLSQRQDATIPVQSWNTTWDEYNSALEALVPEASVVKEKLTTLPKQGEVKVKRTSPTTLMQFSESSFQATDLTPLAIANQNAFDLMASDTDGNPSPISQAEAASDQTVSKQGFYVSVAGAVQSRGDAQDFIGKSTFSPDYGLMGAVGYRMGNIRLEGEYNYFKNNFSGSTFFKDGTTEPLGPAQSSPGAYVDGRALMFNAYYDIPIKGSALKPYIGAGVGVYEAHIVNLSPAGFGGFVANATSSDRFAFQLRTGLSYSLSRELDVFLGYRYFQGKQFEYPIENSPLVLKPNGLESHSGELGIRYNF